MNKKKRKNKTVLMISISIISLCLISVSLLKIINWYSNIKEVKSIKYSLSQYVKKTNKAYNIDFKKLKKQNSDAVAYLKVNNTEIDYVVVKGKDNDYYLNHDFKQNYNIAGWVFASYQNKIDGTDKNIVIFGHNMKDGSMFGTMKNILNKKWYNNKKNLTIEFVTEKGTFYYKVFSIYHVKPEDYYINTDFNSDKEYEQFLKTIKNRSIKDFKIGITRKDKIITLSTCSITGIERVVLHAKKIEK